MPLTLASKSKIRAQMLARAGVPFDVKVASVDEAMIKEALLAEGAKPRDIADTLAELKAQRVADKGVPGFVLGSDQILEHKGDLLSKPTTPEEAKAQLMRLAGTTHRLLSAAVLIEDGKPVWRAVTEARLTMRKPTPAYLDDYIHRNWDNIRHCVGSYQIEGEGARFFVQITGDTFTVMGMPLLPVLQYLTLRGFLEG